MEWRSTEEILAGRKLQDGTFPRLFVANRFEASPRLVLCGAELPAVVRLGWYVHVVLPSAAPSTTALQRNPAVLELGVGSRSFQKRGCFLEKAEFALLPAVTSVDVGQLPRKSLRIFVFTSLSAGRASRDFLAPWCLGVQ